LFVSAGGGNLDQSSDFYAPPDPWTVDVHSLSESELRATVLEAREQLDEQILHDVMHLQLEESRASNETVQKLANTKGFRHVHKLGRLEGKESAWRSDMRTKQVLAERSRCRSLRVKRALDDLTTWEGF